MCLWVCASKSAFGLLERKSRRYFWNLSGADEGISTRGDEHYEEKYVDLISIYNFHLMSVIIKVHTL